MSLVQGVVGIARKAGKVILDVYQQDFAVMHKDDQSPVTQADLLAHQCIVEGLNVLTPELPVLSEESAPEVAALRMTWSRYWLVDPLDGTREFINRNGEFTVNIALVDNGIPVLGVVHAPTQDRTWWGVQGAGAFVADGDQPGLPIHVAPSPMPGQPWRVVGSRSHASPVLHDFVRQLPAATLQPVGSSLKFCLVAEGTADLCPRMGPTSEWDTAAGQAVVEAAGGQVLGWPALVPLRYNRNPDSLINPDFVVCAKPHPDWARR